MGCTLLDHDYYFFGGLDDLSWTHAFCAAVLVVLVSVNIQHGQQLTDPVYQRLLAELCQSADSMKAIASKRSIDSRGPSSSKRKRRRGDEPNDRRGKYSVR